jgi:hypothetical protein
MRPDTHATIEVETPPVPALDAGAGWVLSIARRRRLCLAPGRFFQLNPGLRSGLPRSAARMATASTGVPTANGERRTARTVLPCALSLENSISGARRCTKVHGGVLCSPGKPSLGRPARSSRPWKLKSGGPPSVLRHPTSVLPGARPGPVTNRDKTRQKATNHDIPGFGDSESLRSALVFFSKTVRFWTGFGPVFVQILDTWTGISLSVIGSHVWSSLLISAGMAGVCRSHCACPRIS